MSRVTESPSSQFAQSIRFLILPATILVALACACGETREVLNILATETVSPAIGIPGGGVATETTTPLPPDFPTPTPTVPAEPTVTPTRTPTMPIATVAPTSTPAYEIILGEADLELAVSAYWYQSSSVTLVILNHGPSLFIGNLEYVCVGEGTLQLLIDNFPLTHEIDHRDTEDVVLDVGGTHVLVVDLDLTTEVYKYGIICSIDAGEHDPNVSNNGVWFVVP